MVVAGEIQRLAGDNMLQYLIRIAEGYVDYLSRLPDDIVRKIILYLELDDIVRFGSTCRKNRDVCSSLVSLRI